MKNKKRNITMIAVLVFVCAAVALNWSYNNRWGHPNSEMVSAEDSAMLDAAAADADAAPAEESTASGYFAEARLTRQPPLRPPRRRQSTAPSTQYPPWRPVR